MTIIRTAMPEDAEGILAIYKPVVRDTPISFELEIPDIAEMQTRIKNTLESHAYLVAEHTSKILGYAYGSSFRPREAYNHSSEVTVYVHPDNHKQGIGKILYSRLISELSDRGFHMALAGIALPNDASVALHKSCGFERVGIFREVGFKFNKWHDVEWWQKPLSKHQQDKP